MSYQEIVVLHPSHGLEDFPTDLPDEKAAGLLNAFAVAWHPCLLATAKSLPGQHRAEEPPSAEAGLLVLVPPACDELLPVGWLEQARAAGAAVVSGASSREELVRAIGEPLNGSPPLDADIVADFFALGACRLMLELLTRRMHHFGDMDEGRLRKEAVAAAEAAIGADLVAAKTHLRASFELLLEVRERFYPVECYLLDLCLLIPRLADPHFQAAITGPKPVNLLASGADFATILRNNPALRDAILRGLDGGTLDVLGGEWNERPVPLLPLTSTLREFEIGHNAFRHSLQRSPTTWARRRYGFSTLLPQILHRFGYRGALHVALDDGIYPDAEQSKIRWEGCDGTVIDGTTRIPLAADSASSFLRFPMRLAESMQQDQTAVVLWARWPEVRSPFWNDLERMHDYSPVLGRFVTCRQFFEQTEDPGRLSKFEEKEYLSPFFIQAVAAEEPDPNGRFQRHFERRARFDAGCFLDGLAAVLGEQPIGSAERLGLEEQLERSGPDLPPRDEQATKPFDDAELAKFVERSARRLGDVIMRGSTGEPGYLVLNPLSFDRTVIVEFPRMEVPPPVKLPVRGAQFDATHRHVTLDLPACGYVWLPLRSPKSAPLKGALSDGPMIRNEFIEVHVNEETGGIAKVKQYGRKPNRLSQQLAFRFPRERTLAGQQEADFPERTFYSQMRCNSLEVASHGPGLGEIVTAGNLFDPEDGSPLAGYKQTVRVWRGRPVIELEIELNPVASPSGDPWSNYFASRFAWNDSTATLTRSVLGGAHPFQLERFESPHFLEIATESERTTILNHGLPFHRKTGPRMVDSILIVGGETARRFRFGIAIDASYPMQAATDALAPPVILETPNGPPAAGQSGWLFHLNAKNVQIVQILPLKEPDSESEEVAEWQTAGEGTAAGFGFALRLVETEGRHRPIELRCFRTPAFARQRDFRGRTISSPRVVDDAVHLELTAYEIVDVELRFGVG